jgi:hypothetical protein
MSTLQPRKVIDLSVVGEDLVSFGLIDEAARGVIIGCWPVGMDLLSRRQQQQPSTLEKISFAHS